LRKGVAKGPHSFNKSRSRSRTGAEPL
jgi:hypothetical protein